ncbi:defense protein l(2)34Fc [Drosophila ficusphila]|uniref:defense protein l(2)34Fc n=1 Tax=Drosophila ficusphila TaxID=30025 RepID=UPI0007E73F15|nr:defense protein l(2)34Fc [Drosophila ficusphila]XP_017044044.1 defense protein l(2)34Fc [Drosophila ficusphila]
MFRLLVIAACLAISVNAYRDGAPATACGDLTPQHGAKPQSTKSPYSLSGLSHVRSDQKLTLSLGGDEFLGFIIQARDGQNRVVGQFNVLDAKNSQTLDCSGKANTLTHLNANKGSPLTSLQFEWIPPAGYKGNVKFMATVVQTGFVYWVGRVTKDVNVE